MMMIKSSRLLILLISWIGPLARGFSPSTTLGIRWQSIEQSKMPLRASREDPTEDLTEERKAALFQFLLRDLQVEGVPLLEVDADRLHILQAALWTTMAEMSTQTDEQKACLIFEAIPIAALRAFVDDFMMLKAQDRLTMQIPEIARFNLSLVGKGVGPAILIEASAQAGAEIYENPIAFDINRNTAAMKIFVDRMVAEKQVSGYPSTTDGGSVSSSLAVDSVPSMSFTACSFPEACHMLSSFWNQVCAIMAHPGELRSSMLLLPGVDGDDFPRFVAIAELISRSLCLYRTDDTLELLHFHPLYDRDSVFPDDRPAHGHIPPISWLKPMLQSNGDIAAAQEMSDDDIRLANYLRRAPTSAVCIVPVELWDAGLGAENGVVNLEIDGIVQQASGIAMYSKNVRDAAQQGESALRGALAAETAILR